jgi:hypothetical protein
VLAVGLRQKALRQQLSVRNDGPAEVFQQSTEIRDHSRYLQKKSGAISVD